MPALNDEATTCPCGRAELITECCGPIVAGTQIADTAEDLMRSRYTAFVQATPEAATHLLRTWHESTRPESIRFAPNRQWRRLHVHSASGGLLAQAGHVHFSAAYIQDGEAATLEEHSIFGRDDQGLWVYVGPRAPSPSSD